MPIPTTMFPDSTNPRKRRAISPPDVPDLVPEKRACRQRKTVRFASSPPQELCCSNYDAGMTEEERTQVRSDIWYTRKEYDEFLRDRVQTIRVFRSVGGNRSLLEPNYCLRGLEPYQSPSLNTEMHSHRFMYLQTVLKEQNRQRKAGNPDPVRIQQQVEPMSSWALQRAQRLAILDVKEAGYAGAARKTHHSSRSRRQTSSALRRSSLPTMSSTHHAHVDVDKLKEWNVRLLKQLMHSRAPSCDDDNDLSLYTLMSRGRRRRDSLTTTTTPLQNPMDLRYYTPVRRDSLNRLA